MNPMLLYRPVGLEELRHIYDARMRAFPPRLPDQPIFYPVTNTEYATRIAADWNTKSGTKGGFVTRFAVKAAYASKFERRVVGAREHEELWVPAEELEAFNAQIEGPIEVIGAYFGEGYRGYVAERDAFAGTDAHAQLTALMHMTSDERVFAIAENRTAIFLNFFYWEQCASSAPALLDALRRSWNDADIRLGVMR